ncbi:MAG: MFS transporter [Candidatus Hodarchaeota archaeon]
MVGVLAVLFFVASSYGVQRTILSTYVGEQLPLEEWFIRGAWLSIAFTLSGFGIFKAIAGFITGIYTQKIGVRNIILIGASCFTIGSLPLLFSEGNPILLGIGNSVLGIGEGLLYAAVITYLISATSVRRRALIMGVMESSVYGGYSFGALIAGLIVMISPSTGTVFMFSMIVSLIGLILGFFTVKSTVISETQEEIKKLRTPIDEVKARTPLRTLLTRPTVVTILLNGHISKMVDSIIVLYLPLLLSNGLYGYGITFEETGVIIAAFTFFWAISMPFAGRISDRIGRKTPLLIGLILEAFAMFGFVLGQSPFLILFSLSAMGGIGVGLYYPILPSIAVDITSDQDKPRIIGLYRAIKDFGYFTGPLAAGLVAQYWYDTTFRLSLYVPISLAGLLLLIGAIMLVLVRETHPGWTQFQTTLEHARIVEESVIQATKGLILYLEQKTIPDSNYQSRLTRYSLRAKNLEVQADRQLEDIVVQTYQSLHRTPDAGNFLRFARRLDRVAGLVLSSLYHIQDIPIEEIPPLIQAKLHDASIALRSLVRTTVDVLQILSLKVDAVAGVYHVVRERETDLDLLYQMMNRHLLISAHEMHFGTWFAIKEVITLIESAADSAEDAAEVINILAVKYKT